MIRTVPVYLLLVGVLSLFMYPARAQWAVVDAPAIVQLVQQVADLEQQIELARQQVDQARQEWQSITGDRGMQNLLGSVPRNYLPARWPEYAQAAGGDGSLGADVNGAVAAMSVLSPAQLEALPPAARQLVQDARQWTGLGQAVARQALAHSSDRFASLQQLINAIGSAGDQKAVLDLNARIGAELGMLQNEQTKLQMFAESWRAQSAGLAQRSREQVIDGHGAFGARFQPAP